MQADRTAFRRPAGNRNMAASRDYNFGSDDMDFSKKILHASWHPQEDTVAVAAANNLFMFNANNMDVDGR